MWTILGFITIGIIDFCIGFLAGAIYVAYWAVGKTDNEETDDFLVCEPQEQVLGKAETGDKR